MPDLGNHAAYGRRVGHLDGAADAIKPEPDQGLPLFVTAPDRAADLFDRDGVFAGRRRFAHDHCPRRERVPRFQSAAAASASTSRRRACRVETLMLRRAATERGLSWRFNASNVARTMLYGLDDPIDFATTSCMPSVSNTARIGPP